MTISDARRLELQRMNVLHIQSNKGLRFTDKFFPYTSGQIGPYFIQSVDVERYGEHYRIAIDSLAELVIGVMGEDGFDVISGGESRDWDFSNPVAYALSKPHAKLYKDPAKNPPLGADLMRKRVVHVADLQNEGSSVEHSWLPQIINACGSLRHAFFYVDRLEDGVQVMKRLEIPSDAVVPLDQNAWQILRDSGGEVTERLYRSLCERLEDKTAWAHRTLITNMPHLESLLKDPKTRAKAEKILNVGYPELKDELLGMLREGGYVHEFAEAKK